jgi:glycosyltransferase involved in cell wall biosynthesis
MKVVFFFRKPHKGFYSIETIFREISRLLPTGIVPVQKELRFFSKGFIARFYISLQAFFNQGDVNHVTGDIHFIVLFLKSNRTILTIHDIGFLNNPNRIKRFLLKQFWLMLPLKRAAQVTVVSRATKSEILKIAGSKYEQKIHVIYNPLLVRYKPNVKVFNSASPRVLQIGTKHNKNLPRLIEAISPLNCKLEVIGELTTEQIELLTRHNIDFINSVAVTNEQVLESYLRSDIVSFVSTYEGFGLPIIEANAIGRVVITSNLLSMPEVGGDAAHFVDPFDVSSITAGFELIIQDHVYRESLITNGFENVKRFQRDSIVQQYVQLYKTLYFRNS